ncbi:MAG: endolytic transglycosylase MltG [Bacteroidales bacterium]|nr:endolytic transglycosylase MltG [Bacteroidales bacterium]
MKFKTILLLIGAAVLAYGFILAAEFFYDHRKPNFSAPVELFVRPGMDAPEVLDTLLASGKVRSAGSLRRAFRSEGSLVCTGHYTMDKKTTSIYAVRMLRKGWQSPVSLTLSGAIRSRGTLARKIGAQMLADSADFAAFLNNPDSLASVGTDTTLLFCHIIPDTYSAKWTYTPREVVELLFRRADEWWTPDRLDAARSQGLSREEVSTLASIVDGETRYTPEQPTIAGVYLNRLRTGMKLQADPTVAYLYGYTLRRILKRHLETESPYNTYINYGLPPGPISCPPKTCLEAVLHPESHSYIFFCANPEMNGSHLFASTYAEHQRNARAFQKALSEKLRNNG